MAQQNLADTDTGPQAKTKIQANFNEIYSGNFALRSVVGDGTVTIPAITVGSSIGMYSRTSGSLNIGAPGVFDFEFVSGESLRCGPRGISFGITVGGYDVMLQRLGAGQVEIHNGTSSPSTRRDLFLRSAIQTPPASITPASNGELVFEATSNTSVTVKLRGTDGTVRSAVLTLS
jgi:hypothetical protein